jgi:hypothetical protein
MNTQRSQLTPAMRARLDRALERGAKTATVSIVNRSLTDALDTVKRVEAAVERVTTDKRLSAAGKRQQLDVLLGAMLPAAQAAVDAAREQFASSMRALDEKARYPRSDTPDRHERMLTARHDLDRLLATAKPGEVAGRLKHAVNTSPDIEELVLADQYDERVALPALGDRFAVDREMWRGERDVLLRERLPEASLQAWHRREAMQDVDAAVTITQHVVAYAAAELNAAANRYGAAPATDTNTNAGASAA